MAAILSRPQYFKMVTGLLDIWLQHTTTFVHGVDNLDISEAEVLRSANTELPGRIMGDHRGFLWHRKCLQA